MKATSPSYVCASCARALRERSQHQIRRSFSTATIRAAPVETARDVPRWKQTPAAMRMPIRLRPLPNQPAWSVNDKQEPVDAAYDSFLGDVGGQVKGRDLLDEETKWLALTHKSFEQGKRGFNDRLAFLGKRIVDLQTSLALLRSNTEYSSSSSKPSSSQSAALQGVDHISESAKQFVLQPARLAQLANSHGLQRVIRWKPRKSNDLDASGIEGILAHTMYSVIGALAMQQGGEVAARAARQRILQPLGLR